MAWRASGALGHGQIWSRWVVRGDPKFTAGLALVQRNAYLLRPYPAGTGAAGLEALRSDLLHPLTPESTTDDVLAGGALAGEGRSLELARTESARGESAPSGRPCAKCGMDQFLQGRREPGGHGLHLRRQGARSGRVLLMTWPQGTPQVRLMQTDPRPRGKDNGRCRSVTVVSPGTSLDSEPPH